MLCHLDLTVPAEAAHGIGQAGALGKLFLVQPPESRNEPTLSPQQLGPVTTKVCKMAI